MVKAMTLAQPQDAKVTSAPNDQLMEPSAAMTMLPARDMATGLVNPVAVKNTATGRIRLHHSISLTSPSGRESDLTFDFDGAETGSLSSHCTSPVFQPEQLQSGDLMGDQPSSPPWSPGLEPRSRLSSSSIMSTTSFESDVSDSGDERGDSTRRKRSHWQIAKTLVRACSLFQRRRYPWIQLAGHSEGFEQGSNPDWILKRSCEAEKVSMQRGDE